MTDSKPKPMTENQMKRRIKELEAENENLRASVGNEELKGWKPNERIEAQYGWVYTWLYPLQSYLGNTYPLDAGKIMSIVTAILAQMSLYGKYGIKIPLEPRGVDSEHYINKQTKYLQRNYDPCDICGETRITHECHIIPRADAGAYHPDNYFTLCPLHHHLFDNSRLTQDEWNTLSERINTKMESAIIYFKQVREPMQQNYWQGKETLPLHLIKK